MFKYGPLLAYSYAMKFASEDVTELHKTVLANIVKNDFS